MCSICNRRTCWSPSIWVPMSLHRCITQNKFTIWYTLIYHSQVAQPCWPTSLSSTPYLAHVHKVNLLSLLHFQLQFLKIYTFQSLQFPFSAPLLPLPWVNMSPHSPQPTAYSTVHNMFQGFIIQSAAEITPTFGGVTARAVEGVQWWKWSRWLAAVLPFSDDAMGWSGEHRGFVVETFFKNNESVIATQRAFRRHFRLGRRAPIPDRKTILLWVLNMRATGSTLKRKPPGRPRSIRSSWKCSDGEGINRAISKVFRKETCSCPRDFRSKCEKNAAPGTRNASLQIDVSPRTTWERLGSLPEFVSRSSTTCPPCSCCVV